MQFNLITQPCIPVLDLQGKPQLLSLRDTLLGAHNVSEIHHDSPVITASLVRFCVALLTDIYRLNDQGEWRKIWSAGAFDKTKVNAYFEQFEDRFDLFHEKYPFYQCAALEDPQPAPLTLFASELSTGNNPTLFSHNLDTVERDYTPVEASHLLLSIQNFALAGLLRRTTQLKGETEPLYWQSAYGGVLIPGAMIWLTGDNLFETLCLNVVPVTPLPDEDDEDRDELEDDLPIWRRDHPEVLRDRQIKGRLEKISPRGTLDRLTFGSRLIRLLPERSSEGADESIVVRRAAFNHGRSLDAGLQGVFDPMQAYRTGKKEGYLIVRLSSERSLWRDAGSLFGLSRKGVKHVPRALHLLSLSIGKVENLTHERNLRLNVAGLANDQAKILLWRHDRMDAPAKVLCDPEIAERVSSLLLDAEETAFSLRTSTRRLCSLFLAPLSVDATGKAIEGFLGADPDRVTSLADAIDTRPTYWARLESEFHRLLLGLSGDADKASEIWKDQVKAEAERAFEEAVISLGDRPQTGKAVALTHAYFEVPSRRTKPEPKARKISDKVLTQKGESQ